MLPLFWYMLKVIICSGILFGYYWFFLRNKIFHQYNRFYLLAAMLLSLLLPLVKINFWQPASQSNQAIRVLRAVSVGDEYMNNIVITAHRNTWSLEQLYTVVYCLVSLIFFLIMLRTFFLIRALLKRYPVQQVEEVAFVNTEDDSTPFSFLKYIFWNSSIDINTSTGRQIFKHEVAHIQEKHTHDKLFVNIILIFCWCNPFFWLYRKELNMIHEFIADKKAVEDSDTAAFAAMILQAAYPKHRFELTNNFFYSPIKRRLMMLTKNKNPRVNYFGRIMVLPLALLVFAAFTFKAKTNSSLYHGKKITVVIDAGHGGQDLGASSTNGIYEKDLTLAIAKKVKELNGNDAIEVILVRDGDVFMNPQQKVTFAKSKNADLFISFHIDNGPKESANTKTGMAVFVAKDEFANTGKSKILASAIINEFSNNYALPVMPQPNQRQGGVWILQANACPTVLIEAGFINNEKDLAYLQTSAAKEAIAKNVLTAIEKYANANNITNNTVKKTEISLLNKAFLKDTFPNKNINITIPKGKQPIYYLDGGQVDSTTVHKLNPNDIASIDVLKDAAAVAQYGDKGKDGVILIKTKSYKQITPGDDADTENALYVINGKIIGKGKAVNSDIDKIIAEKVYVKWLKRTEAIAKYGKEGADGACEVSYINGEIIKIAGNSKATNDLATNQEPKIYLGNYGGGIIKLDYLKSITEISLSDDYSLVSCAVWIVGPGIGNNAVQVSLNSKSLSPASEYLGRCKTGAQIVFDNVQLKDKDGKIFKMKDPPVFSVADESDYKVFTQVEQNPQFTGGQEAWLKYLRANLKVNTPVDNGAKAGIYKVVLNFIVNADGSLSDIKCETDPGFGICTEAIRFIKTTPKWQPAVQNGRKVNAYMKQPITFLVEE